MLTIRLDCVQERKKKKMNNVFNPEEGIKRSRRSSEIMKYLICYIFFLLRKRKIFLLTTSKR